MSAGYRPVSAILLLIAVALGGSSAAAQNLERARRAGDERGGATDEARLRTLSRLLMARSRNLADLKVDDQEILLHCGKLDAAGPDFESLDQLTPGQVQVLTEAASTKLRTEVDLEFSGTTVPAGNVAEGHPGLYSLWLKRVEGGWHLVFNSESDVWGTQRDPSRDVEEIALEYETTSEASEQMKPALIEAAGGGVLELRWGRHRFSAQFSVGNS